MPWSVDWDADGARGAMFGDDENTVYQHETVRFTVSLRGTDQNARDFVANVSNWTEPPRMIVHWIEGRDTEHPSEPVEPARDSLLAFEYQFRHPGRKRIEFRGEIDMRRAQGERHGGVGARSTTVRERESADTEVYESDVYTTYPPLALSIPFQVEERATEGEAHATTAGEGPTSRARERVLREEREEAADERSAAETAESEDEDRRRRRARRARDSVRPALLRMPSPWNRLFEDEEVGGFDEATMGEYARDLRAAIRVTHPISMNDRDYVDEGRTYTGYWTWAFDDDDIVFYFHATQTTGGDGRLRPTDGSEEESVRRSSGRDKRFRRDEWMVGILPGARQKTLSTAEDFARSTDWERLTAIAEIVDRIMTAFDVLAVATGMGSILAGIDRAARWLLENAARLGRRAFAAAARHSDDLARAAARTLAHGDDVVRASDDVARGLASESSAASGAARRGDDVVRATDDTAGGSSRAARSTDDTARGIGTAGSTANEGRGLAAGPPRLADEALGSRVDDAFDSMTSGVPSTSAAAAFSAPEPYVVMEEARRTFGRARREFSRLQPGYARRLALDARSGAQVHHAIELNVIQRYGDNVFSVEELNALSNMRGIVPERTAAGEMSTRYGLRQLHNSAIRRRWDEMYEQINRIIADEGLVAGTPVYRTRVRGLLEHGRDVIDHQFSEFFSGSGARLTEEFVNEASDAARRGGRSSYGLTTRGTDGRITGTAPRFRVADPDLPRVRVELPDDEIEEAVEGSRASRRMSRD